MVATATPTTSAQGTIQVTATDGQSAQGGQAAGQSVQESMAADYAADIEAKVSAQIKNALKKLSESTVPHIGEPSGWVDIYASGPFQPGASTVPPALLQQGPLLPHAVVRVGEYVDICATLVLNPYPLYQDPGIVPADFLSTFRLPYTIEFVTLNMSTGQPAPELSTTIWGDLYPGQWSYTHCAYFQPTYRGCIFETNVCFRILDCYKSSPSASPLAGFATWVRSYDEPSFLDKLLGVTSEQEQTGYSFNQPIRFMTYQ